MRISTAAALVATASSLAAASSNDRVECFQTRSRDLARLSNCGDLGSISNCLSQSSPLADAAAANDLASVTVELESCFLDAGCSRDEAQTEAFWTLRRCEAEPADLKRRFAGLAAAPITPAVAARTPEIGAVGARIVFPRATTVESRPANCLTASTSSTKTCPTQTAGAESGKTSCFTTAVVQSVCADGLICQSAGVGEAVSCLYAHNSLDTGGIVVAIVLAGAIALSILGVCFFCCRERNTQKRLAKAAEAAAIAREAKNAAMVANKRPTAGARMPSGGEPGVGQPLMPESNPTGPNPFDDTHPALR